MLLVEHRMASQQNIYHFNTTNKAECKHWYRKVSEALRYRTHKVSFDYIHLNKKYKPLLKMVNL